MEETDSFTIYALSEYAVTVAFGDGINLHTLQRINRFNASLRDKPFDGFRTTVPAYATLSIFFDPLEVIQSRSLRGINCYERVSNYVKKLENEVTQKEAPVSRTVTIPVCYGGTFGPDLDEVAQLHGIAAEDVVTMHSTTAYHVYLIGFTPGFAYLGGMPEALATPRKSVPRHAVPPGSVGIAGKQTGIYPLETPGGWQLIGRTPLRLFDPNRAQPTLLKTGDRVMFKAIGHELFESYKSE